MSERLTFYTRSGILKATIASVLTWLGDEFEKYGEGALKVYLVRSISDMRQPARMRKERASDEAPVYGEEAKDTVEYPILRIALGEIGLDSTKAGFRRNRANNGVVVGIDKDRGVAVTDTFVPVNLVLGSRFETTDLDQALIYAQMLLLNGPKLTFTFVNEGSSVPIETSVEFETSLTVPQADLGSTGSPYALETVFKLNTYIGNITEQRIIKAITVSYTNPQSIADSFLNIDTVTATLLEKDTMHYYDLFDRSSNHFKYSSEG